MSRDIKQTNQPASTTATARTQAVVELLTSGDAGLVSVSGLVDERFLGFGNVGPVKSLVINVAGMTRMTSFGVRQWLKGMDALPKTITDLYLLGCPTFFVDQLNMVLNFAGASKILTVVAPYTCPSCGVESGETIDVLVERANLAKGGLPEKECARCGGKLEFDETPESYFSFVNKYAASSIAPSAAQMLAAHGLYTSLDSAAEKPPRIIKLVHGSVTYFRIIGTIGSMFRARPLLVGAEGEVVIDLAEVNRFDAAGQKEWKRLLKSLATQVPAVTLVDVNESFLAAAGDTLTLARHITVASVLVPYVCIECGRASQESESILTTNWPRNFEDHVCTTCGGTTRNKMSSEALTPLQKASTSTPPASAKLISQRDEILSRALTDANVAQAGEGASATVAADDTILGKYKIVRRLSEGGMAEVFLAKQVGIGGFEKPVALKRIQRKLLDSRHMAIDMFLNEAKIAGRLTHPNIVQVLDVGEVQGALYLAMEYVHGKDLRDVIKKLQKGGNLMPLGEACYVVREVAQALHHAYWSMDMAGQRLSVVHRDVSPQNIILSYEGTVKLLDFGVAMSSVTEHAETMIVGKWLYMSPETTLNEHIDHRSDLFSLGVILYLLCSGYMPFAGKEPKEIVKKIRSGQYKPLQEIAPQVPEQLASLVSRLLAPNPDDRPQRGQEVAQELTEIARMCGFESSGPNIANLLGHLFPEHVGGTEKPTTEIVRTMSQSMSSVSANSFTPRTTANRQAIDVSVAYPEVPAPTTGPVSAQIPVASIAIPPLASQSEATPRSAQPPTRTAVVAVVPAPTPAPARPPTATAMPTRVPNVPVRSPSTTTPHANQQIVPRPRTPAAPTRAISIGTVLVIAALVILLGVGAYVVVGPSW
jgi:serine/threonine protein kinase